MTEIKPLEDGLVGLKVKKKNGYSWPGVIVSCFYTLAGEVRVVVECTVPEVSGALHIYSLKQLESDS